MDTQHKVAVVDYTPTSTAKMFEAYPPRTLWGDVWRRYCRHRLAMAGTVLPAPLSCCSSASPR